MTRGEKIIFGMLLSFMIASASGFLCIAGLWGLGVSLAFIGGIIVGAVAAYD